jgi:DNA-binding NarL/FixJ family response regulator
MAASHADRGAARVLLDAARQLKSTLPGVERSGGPDASLLSDREQEIAAMVLAGMTHKEIGGQLYISTKTVEHHVAKLRQRLGASSRAELLAELRSRLDVR